MPVPPHYPTIVARPPRARFAPRGLLKVVFVLGLSSLAATAALVFWVYQAGGFDH
jgi:hypothetical protein